MAWPAPFRTDTNDKRKATATRLSILARSVFWLGDRVGFQQGAIEQSSLGNSQHFDLIETFDMIDCCAFPTSLTDYFAAKSSNSRPFAAESATNSLLRRRNRPCDNELTIG